MTIRINLAKWFPERPYFNDSDFGQALEAYHNKRAQCWKELEQYDALLMVGGGSSLLDMVNNQRLHDVILGFDHDDGAVYFNVLANGLPYLTGAEWLKGSHSMSAYHSTELCYLSAIYLNLLITKNPMAFYFKPKPRSFKDDILPPGSIRLEQMWIDDQPYSNFDASALTVKLPASKQPMHVKVRIVPA
ncbi:MAG: hypothetical protein MI924_09145 [Chloroflexales bacterium]|nr:hypothetical protein [Chloroflexales bacterium]